MLVRQTFFQAAIDKLAELRSTLEENVRNNPLGLTGGLTRPVFGSLFSFGVSSLWENMEALEKDRDAAEANPQVQAFRAKVGSLIREPVEMTVSEITVPGAADLTGRYRQVTQFYPAIGKQREVQSILEELAKSQQAAGRPNFSCSARLFSSSGPIIAIRDTYETLAEQENVSREFTSGEATRKLITNLPALVRRPFSSALRELIVAYGG